MKNEIETNLKIDANVEDFDNTPKMLKPMELGDERFKKEVLVIQDKYNLWGEISFTNEETYYHIKLELGFTDYYNNPKIYIKYNILDKTINTNNVDNPYSNFKLYKYIHKYIIEVIELIEKTESN
jgi:hypothetical protein